MESSTLFMGRVWNLVHFPLERDGGMYRILEGVIGCCTVFHREGYGELYKIHREIWNLSLYPSERDGIQRSIHMGISRDMEDCRVSIEGVMESSRQSSGREMGSSTIFHWRIWRIVSSSLEDMESS